MSSFRLPVVAASALLSALSLSATAQGLNLNLNLGLNLGLPLALPGANAPAAGGPQTAAPAELSVPRALLDAALKCDASVDGARRPPVLLVHGTTLTADANFRWNYLPALRALDMPTCTIDLPISGMGEVQAAAEYVVHAVREMNRRSGQKVQIVGYSQGGMLPRWSMKFWPDIRPMVEDMISLSASNHGTLDARVLCKVPCAPAISQQRTGSNFLSALNRDGEVLEGIDYTSIYTRYDEIVVPNFGPRASSRLRGGEPAKVTNVMTQQLCPLNVADHIAIGTYDSAAFALVLDALTHPGPAQLGRADRGACRQPFMPGVNPATFAIDYLRTLSAIGQAIVTSPTTLREPALRCYAGGAC